MPTTFANTINGNEILAKRSQCDYAGNDLQTTYATKAEVTTGLAGKQDTISDLATIRSGASAGATAVQPGDLATVATSGSYADLSNKPTIPSGTQLVPAATSADADKVLTVNAQGTPEWATGGGDDGADWDAEQGEPGYIENKPVPKTLTAGTGISITENQSTITVAATGGAGVTDVEVDGTSVVSGGVASITMPTVDQTYDASSTNAQSGVAVASGIAGAIGDLPTNLSAAQLLALKQALGVDETVLWSDTPVYAHGDGAWNPSITLSETVANFGSIKCYLGRKIGGETCDEVIEVPVINGEAHHRIPAWPEGSVSGNWFLGGIDFVGASGSQWGSYNGSGQTQTKYLPNGWFPGGFWKVVGIHRIASN